MGAVSLSLGAAVELRLAQPVANAYAFWRQRLPFRGSGVLFRALKALERAGAPLPIAEGEEGVRVEIGTDWVCNTILLEGAWERAQTARLRRLTTPGGVWVDVGANVGYYSLLASRWVGPAGRVYAVEPVPATRERLARNLRLNGAPANIVVVPCAFGASCGFARMTLEPDPGHSHVDAHGSIEVMVSTVDTLVEAQRLRRVDVIKIDTEGHDLDVLYGARATLRRFAPVVVAEVFRDDRAPNSEARVREFLRAVGYASRVFKGDVSYDLIGVPEARAGELSAFT